jgi:hypothetical protein
MNWLPAVSAGQYPPVARTPDESNALDRECRASVDSPSIAISGPAASTRTSIRPTSAGSAHRTRVASSRAHISMRRRPRRGPRDGALIGDLGCLQSNRPRRESAVERHLALPVALHRSSLELHESPVVDPYTSWVVVNEVCELSSPSVRRLQLRRTVGATASATDVQHRRRRCLDHQTPGEPPVAGPTRRTARCTRADSIKIGDRL